MSPALSFRNSVEKTTRFRLARHALTVHAAAKSKNIIIITV